MSTSLSQDDFAMAGRPSPAFVQQVRGLQMITAVFAVGATVIVGMMLIVTNGQLDGIPVVLAYMGIVMGVVQLSTHVVVPKVVVAQQLKRISHSDLQPLSDEERQLKIIGVLRGPHIIGSAMLEAAAVINAIAYMVDHWIGNLAIAGFLIVLLVLRIPSIYGMYNRVNDRLQEIADS